jgi:hypothetical protein
MNENIYLGPIKQELILSENIQKNIPRKEIKMYTPKKFQTGSGLEDKGKLLCLIENIKYAKTTWSADDKDYLYEFITEEIDGIKYNKLENNSYYLANGFTSTVVAVKCKTNNIELNDKILVLKLLLINIKNKNKIIEDKNAQEWNNYVIIDIYKRFKELFGNFIGDIYFYGDNIENNYFDNYTSETAYDIIKKKKYIYGLENGENKKRTAFTIGKFYKQKIDINLEKNMLILKKLVAIISYTQNKGYYIADFKIDNIGFDSEDNIVCIDIAENLFVRYTGDNNFKFRIYDKFDLGPGLPCYFNKKINNMFTEEDINNILNSNFKHKKLSDDPEMNKTRNQNIMITNTILKFIRNNEYDSVDGFTSTNINLGFDKLNSISIIYILFSIFFEKIYEEKNEIMIEKNFSAFIFSDVIYFKRNNKYIKIQLKINKHEYVPNSRLTKIIYLQNLCNKNLINKLVDTIQPLHEEYTNYCNYLKPIIYDSGSGTGLIAPDYDNIPTYEMVYEYLFAHDNKNNDILFETYSNLIKENLKMGDVEIINNFTQQNSYFEWRNKRKIINNCHAIKINYV